jgi:hypothetical protein
VFGCTWPNNEAEVFAFGVNAYISPRRAQLSDEIPEPSDARYGPQGNEHCLLDVELQARNARILLEQVRKRANGSGIVLHDDSSVVCEGTCYFIVSTECLFQSNEKHICTDRK